LVEAEAAHKAEDERLRLARMDQERNQTKVAERAEAARHASLYRARLAETNCEMPKLEAAEANAAEALARQKGAEAAHCLAVSRQLELL